MNVKIAISADFLVSLDKLPKDIKKKVHSFVSKFQLDPQSSGINYETINAARDKNLRSVRIDQDYRGIVFKPEEGDVYMLMFVAKHDDAYKWASSKRVAINPVQGSLQVYTASHEIELVEKQESHSEQSSAIRYFAEISNDKLSALGVPEESIEKVRKVDSEFALDAIKEAMPIEAYEALFLVMAGEAVEDILAERELAENNKIDLSDYKAALDRIESKAHFVIVDDDQEAASAILNSPLAFWRIFLHPTQRRLSAGNKNGPVRILGGAGTGKTVLAMHRAKWLAENAPSGLGKVLFTTFTRNLALDIKENLKELCSKEEFGRIDVINLDSWVSSFLKNCGYHFSLVYGRNSNDKAKTALINAIDSCEKPEVCDHKFIEDELDDVVLTQGIRNQDAYRRAKRTGRGRAITRAERDQLWKIFEAYRRELAESNLKEVADAYADAVELLKDREPQFSSVIIDETQDFSAPALRLIRTLTPERENDLFFVGDGHQRIYPRNKAVMGQCGINIKGRSKKLYLNYRTTEEIRARAVAELEGIEVDDLDGSSDEVKKYKSVSNGNKPLEFEFSNLDGAFKQLTVIAKDAISRETKLCIICPTNSLISEVGKALVQHKVNAVSISKNEIDDPTIKDVRLATVHRAKGLEFEEVLLLVPKDWGNDSRFQNERQLFYVALTRAKKNAYIIRY